MIEFGTVILFAFAMRELWLSRNSVQIFLVLSAALALFSLVIVPWVGYRFFDNLESVAIFRKQMRVPSSEYFGIVLPIVCAYVMGILSFQWQRIRLNEDALLLNRRIRAFAERDWWFLIRLFAVIELFSLLSSFAPGSLQFVFFLIGSLKFGLLLILLIKSKSRGVKILLILGYPLMQILASGMFQASLALIAAIVVLSGELKNKRFALMIVAFAIPFTVGLVIAKNDLRAKAQSNELSIQELISVTGLKKSRDGESTLVPGFINDADLFELYRRTNQGFIVSAVIENQMNKSRDESLLIIETALACITPRFLWPDKPKAGGQDKIRRFTDLNLQGGTSMNISPFGEILIDFHGALAVVVGFLYARFLCVFLRRFTRAISEGQASILLLPYLLSQVYKVETDMLSIGNILIKVAVLSILLVVIDRKILEGVVNLNGAKD